MSGSHWFQVWLAVGQAVVGLAVVGTALFIGLRPANKRR
jgi:hypothetical protein